MYSWFTQNVCTNPPPAQYTIWANRHRTSWTIWNGIFLRPSVSLRHTNIVRLMVDANCHHKRHRMNDIFLSAFAQNDTGECLIFSRFYLLMMPNCLCNVAQPCLYEYCSSVYGICHAVVFWSRDGWSIAGRGRLWRQGSMVIAVWGIWMGIEIHSYTVVIYV